MVALVGRALFAGLLSLGRNWAPEERATALASGLAQIGAGHPDAVRLVSQAVAEFPDVAAVLPPGFDGPQYLPPLSLAAAAGNADLTSALLGAGAAPNPRSAGSPGKPLGWTPLFLACREGHAGVAAALLDVGGVDPTACVAAGGVTPLMAAAEGGHAPTIELLLSRAPGLDVDARDARRGMTALHLAALHDRDGAVVAALVQTGGADPWAPMVAGPGQEPQWRGFEGYAPFHLAIAHAALTSAEALWRAVGPAVLTAPTPTEGLSPLHVAIAHGQQRSLDWLLHKLQEEKEEEEEEEEAAAGAAVSARDARAGATPLIYATQRGNAPMVELLLKVAAPARRTGDQDWNGWDALHTATAMAAEDGHDDAIVRLLLMAGADPMRRIAAHLPDSSPLCAAASSSSSSSAAAASGPPPSTTSLGQRRLPHEGWTAPALAVARGRMDLLALLSEGYPAADVALDAWAALAAKVAAGKDEALRLRALDYVVRGAVRHAGAVRALLARQPTGHSLGLACLEGQSDAVRALLRQHGAAAPAESGGVSSSPSPLGMAVRGGHPELVRLMLGWTGDGGRGHDQQEQKLACGLRALAEAALDGDLGAAAEGGDCVARRRAARRWEVLAVLEERLPCEVVQTTEEENVEEVPEEEDEVEEEATQEQEVPSPAVPAPEPGKPVEVLAPQGKKGQEEETCGGLEAELQAGPVIQVEVPEDLELSVLLIGLFLILLICAAACYVAVRLVRFTARLVGPRRGSPEGLPPAAEGADVVESMVVSEEAEAVLEQPGEEKTLSSSPTVEELRPLPELVPVVVGAEKVAGDEKAQGVEGQGQEEEEEEESFVVSEEDEEEDFSSSDDDDDEDYSQLASFTMGALVRGPVCLPPEASRRLLEELGTSPDVFQRRAAPPGPARVGGSPLKAAALSFAEEGEGRKGGGGGGAEQGAGGEGGGVQEVLLPVDEPPSEDAAHRAGVRALDVTLEAEKEETEPGPKEAEG